MNTPASSFGWLLLGLCALTGCEPSEHSAGLASRVATPVYAAGTSTDTRTDRPAIDDLQAQALLTRILGPTARLRGAWAGPDPGASVAVCADDTIRVADHTLRLLALCTTLRVDDIAAGGRVDLFAFGLQDGKPAVIAESRALRHGVQGNPGQVRIVHIGHERYAFDISYASFDDEGELQQRTWYIAREGRFDAAMTVPVRYVSDGRAWCRYAETTTCEGAATDLAYDLHIDARAIDADTYPVTIAMRGTRCDRAIAVPPHALAFDAGTSTYAVPQALGIPASDCHGGQTPSSEQNQSP